MLLILIFTIFLQSIKVQKPVQNYDSLSIFSYSEMGYNWPGICSIGSQQSPINISLGQNTIDDTEAFIDFQYKSENLKSEKLFYDGVSLSVKANLGELTYSKELGQKEYYKAEKISIHYPSEHLVTMNNQTPRQPVEVQIHHKFIRATDPVKQIEKAVVSILFDESSEVANGDQFLYKLGLGIRQHRINGSEWTVEANEFIDSTYDIPGVHDIGLDYSALIYLKMILDQNHHLFTYFGSETKPPCEENTRWFIFAKPRSLSSHQLNYIKEQVLIFIKVNETKKGLQFYDASKNGMILSMRNGIGKL